MSELKVQAAELRATAAELRASAEEEGGEADAEELRVGEIRKPLQLGLRVGWEVEGRADGVEREEAAARSQLGRRQSEGRRRLGREGGRGQSEPLC